MPTVALIGPELYPIPPIRGGAAELFIEKVAEAPHGLASGGHRGVRPGAARQEAGAGWSISACPSRAGAGGFTAATGIIFPSMTGRWPGSSTACGRT